MRTWIFGIKPVVFMAGVLRFKGEIVSACPMQICAKQREA
jgi:hypothetical protein